jgi:DNA-binding SARP family transcriptional activator
MPAALQPAPRDHRLAGPEPRPREPRLLAADAFDLFPNAVMVCDRRGRVVAANARLRAELGARPGSGATCCSLLGCGRPGTELEHGCITADALALGDEMNPVSVPSPGGRLRISAAPLYEDRSHVVVELRRERAAPYEQPTLRVFTLGGLRIESPDGCPAGTWVDQRAGQLLGYLVCERRRIAAADAIAEAIWPQAGPAAGNSVRHFVHVLRERLEPHRGRRTPSSYVLCRRGGYALAADRVWVDADEFEAEARAGTAAAAAGDARTANPHLERAAQLYEGDFLADDPYAEWALAERERLRAIASDVLRALADLRGEGPEAASCLERLADMEPFDTDVQRRLLANWVRDGRRSRAARHYETFKWRLLREFGEHPGFELAELATGGG